jgi:putative nucleotidyltransferase with HDIG domain
MPILGYLRDRHAGIYSILLMIFSVWLIVLVFPQEGKFKYDFQKGKPWLHDDLVAPFDFAISKTDEEISMEQRTLLKNVSPYYHEDARVAELVKSDALNLLRNEWQKRNLSTADRSLEKHESFLKKFLDEVYAHGVIEMNELIEDRPSDYSVFVLDGSVAEEKELSVFYSLTSAFVLLKDQLASEVGLNGSLLTQVLEESIKQNVLFDAPATTRGQKEAMEGMSLSKDMKQRGERIIGKGELIDEEKYRILQSLRSEYLLQVGGQTDYTVIIAGQAILVSICVSMLVLFLFLFRRDLVSDTRKVTFMLMVLVLFAGLAGLSFRFRILHIYALPFCIFPVLVRSFFDTRVALFAHLASTMIVGIVAPDPFEFVFIQLSGGIFAVFSIISLRNRSQLFITVLIIFAVFGLSYIGISIFREGSFSRINWTYFEWFAISAVLVLFAYPLIFIFEKMFGFISDVSLLELSDINAPLLRELALKSPGTFQHSLQVANLAEEAIYQIGGSSLLVRAGALYHDIGKMEMPLYFIENQATSVNPHDELSFEESAAIIIGHVSKGIELAKKNNLPDAVIDFIRTHHGTTRAEYFYRSFLKNYPEKNIDAALFQYPGPIPFSKETAVLMMADSVEAASRSLKHYDQDTLSALVDKVIDHQVSQNQFSNADITFRQINTIRKIFKKRLLNVYHLRIEYPQ